MRAKNLRSLGDSALITDQLHQRTSEGRCGRHDDPIIDLQQLAEAGLTVSVASQVVGAW